MSETTQKVRRFKAKGLPTTSTEVWMLSENGNVFYSINGKSELVTASYTSVQLLKDLADGRMIELSDDVSEDAI